MGKEFDIVKLSGSENYHLWKFAITNVMDFRGLSDALVMVKEEDGENEVIKLKDASKCAQAKALLSLSVETHIYAHIQTATSAFEIWNILKTLYEDRGLTRRITLLRELISIRLEDADGMGDYIDKIKLTSNKLNGIGFALSSEWLGAIMLAGLTEDFRPLIMGIEANNELVTADTITSKLLDMQSSTSSNAFFNKKGKKTKSKGSRKCYTCGSQSHLANACDKKTDQKKDKNNSQSDKKEKKKVAFVALMCKASNDDWYMDSGSSKHMTNNDVEMRNIKPSGISDIMGANKGKMRVRKCGDITLNSGNTEIEVNRVLHVPDIAVNLLSVYQICANGNTVHFDENGCKVKNADGAAIAYCDQRDGVYVLNKSNEKCMVAKSRVNGLTWHRRLGHINYNALMKMKQHVPGIDFEDSNESRIKNCEVCARAKSSRLPFQRSETRSDGPLQLLHSDLMGPMETRSIGHAKFLLTIIDDYSRYIFVFFLKCKSEVLSKFREFKAYIENQMDLKIKAIRTDNGGEYCSSEFDNFLSKHGIKHELTAPYTPQQNGVAERFNRTLTERAKCLMFDANLPTSYWAEATGMATYLKNRTTSTLLGDKTPYELFHGAQADLSELKIFGSTVMVHVPHQRRKKWDEKSQKMIFVGYDENTKGFRCMDRQTKKLLVSRDVIFHENVSMDISNLDDDSEIEEIGESENQTEEAAADNESVNEEEENQIDEQITESSRSTPSDGEGADENKDVQPSQVDTRKSNRSKTKTHQFQMTYFALMVEPTTVREALEDPNSEKWKEAMDAEMASHKSNKTWTLQPLPRDRKAVKSKWVFKIKTQENDKRYKARLVAKGYSQKYGIDYEETYSPVVRKSSLRILFALAVQWRLKIHQLDAITAYLQADLSEEIYMEQPEGYDDGSGQSCKLNKAIYGLKQAGREWNRKLCASLLKYGLKKSSCDPCIFFSQTTEVIVLVYVDDMLIFYKNQSELNDIREFLHSELNMKDMGHASECIRIRINQCENKIEIDQSEYIETLLKRFDMVNCKIAKTPSDPNVKLSIQMINKETDITGSVPYQQLVGGLLYLAEGTRPDIAFATHDVSRFNAQHSGEHWEAVLRILRYLKGTMDLKLCYENSDDDKKNCLKAYSDSDWASDVDKRRSCTGSIVLLSNGAVTWKSKRQEIVALSSTEAEYVALSETTKEILWIQQLINELKPKYVGCVEIFVDNTSAMSIANEEAFRARTKHIDIRHHHIRQQLELGKIKLSHVSTNHMTADLLTKAINGIKTQECATAMGLK